MSRRTESEIKKLFRQKVKVVPGGPTDKTRGLGMLVVLDALAENDDLPTNDAKSGQKFYRYRTRAEANAPGANGGAVLEEQDYLKVCTYASFVVEFWRDNPADLSEQPRFEQGVFAYDGTPGAKQGYRDGSFSGDLIGLTPVLLKDFRPPVNLSNIPQLDPTRTDYPQDFTVQRSYAGEAVLLSTRQAGGPFPAPATAKGDNNWRPVAEKVAPAVFGQTLSLDEASGMDGDNVQLGRTYAITGPWNGDDAAQVVTTRGIGTDLRFDVSGTVELGGVRQAVKNINVVAGTFELAESGSGTAGGAPQWAAGQQTASALVWYQGKLYRVKQDIANGQSAPDGNTQYYDLVSDPALVALHTVQLAGLGAPTALAYAQAVSSASQNKLDVTKLYALTYTPRHTIAGTSAVNICQPETLLLRARNGNSFHQMGLSQTYGDTVWYDLANTGRLPGSTEGAVIRRFDALYNNDLEIDFRNVVFRRWLADLPTPDFTGKTTGYVSAVDNGRPFRDCPILGYYFKCRNNRWTNFAQTKIASDPTTSIFDYLNFVSLDDNDSRTLNTQFTNAVVRGVTVHSGAWIDGLKIENSQLLNSYAFRVAQRTFFGGRISDSVITGKVVTTEETGFTVIHSQLTTQVLAGKTFIDGAEYKPGGGSATGPWPTPGAGVVDDVANTFRVPIPAGFQNRELGYSLTLDSNPDGAPIPLATNATSSSVAYRQGNDVIVNVGNATKPAGAVGVCILSGAGRTQSAYSTNQTGFTAIVSASLLSSFGVPGAWYLHLQNSGAATVTLESDDTVRIEVTGGTGNNQVQYWNEEAGKKITNGKQYKLSLRARADAPMTLACWSQSNTNYGNLGIEAYLPLTDVYQQFDITFTAKGLVGTSADALPDFLLGDQPGRTIWLSGLVLLEVV